MKTGDGLKPTLIRDFIKQTYQKNPSQNLENYKLDRELSTDTTKVYYDDDKNHAVVSHRGTKGALDNLNNLSYALGIYQLTPRYQAARNTQQAAYEKYGNENVTTVGHSQGAIIAHKLGSNSKEIINVNAPHTFFEYKHPNEYHVRSSNDLISSLSNIAELRNRLSGERNDLVVPSESFDILKEHDAQILNRISSNNIIGEGLKKQIKKYYKKK